MHAYAEATVTEARHIVNFASEPGFCSSMRERKGLED